MDDDLPQEKPDLTHGGLTQDPLRREQDDTPGGEEETKGKFELFWERVTQAGMVEPVLRAGTHLLSIVLVLVVAWAMRTFLLQAQPEESNPSIVQAASLPSPTPTAISPHIPVFDTLLSPQQAGISRLASLYTTIPTRPRVHLITYTVQTGDSVFGIADKFSLKPETILWGNGNVLADNPHRLQPGQILNILPVNGTIHKWSAGENLGKVAEFYQVEASAILEWPGNNFDIFNLDIENTDIDPGTMLIIPGGQREFVDYGPPRIPRDNPAVARTYGPGHCGVIMDGAIGVGSFIWPTTERWISGYDFSPGTNHYGIDIAGQTGNPIWAADNGVVVYAGYSYSGYGNLVVVDHGNEWQSLYAHLDSIYVACGQSVYQGTTIAALGSTGNSSGPHLHFELLFGTSRVNPWNFLP
jgi:murein DD-endopeptidase MepM/ murein hydrolase activator NlpD